MTGFVMPLTILKCMQLNHVFSTGTPRPLVFPVLPWETHLDSESNSLLYYRRADPRLPRSRKGKEFPRAHRRDDVELSVPPA
jgi:hypothetical protein